MYRSGILHIAIKKQANSRAITPNNEKHHNKKYIRTEITCDIVNIYIRPYHRHSMASK